MMTPDTYKKINGMLDALRLKGAIKMLEKIFTDSGDQVSLGKLARIRDTYGYMVQYMLDGHPDSDRSRMVADLRVSLRALAEIARRASITPTDPRYYYATLRFNQLRRERVSEILSDYNKRVSELGLAEATDPDNGSGTQRLRKSVEELSERLFNTLFTSLGEESDYRDVVSYAISGYASPDALSMALSAMTLALTEYYDRAKLTALLDIYDAAVSEEATARALVGVILTLARYPQRVSEDPAITARLSLWEDDLMAYRRLRETLRVLVATADTDRVTAKIQNDLIPGLMNMSPDVRRKLQEGFNAAALEQGEGFNPEWEEILAESGMDRKIRELSQLQEDGADVMMATFANLKQFPFFNKASNWFLPFDIRNTELGLDPGIAMLMDTFTGVGMAMCDSDMYSMALAMGKMPEAQRHMISGQMKGQMDQLKEMLAERKEKSTTPAFDAAVLKAVRDLYRFFKLFRKKDDFHNPFATPLAILSLPVIGKTMLDTEILQIVGHFYFKHEYYAEAVPLLAGLAERNPDSPVVWEQLGYTRMRLGDTEGASVAFDRASLLKTPGEWLLTQMAKVSTAEGRHADASRYWKQVLEITPESLNAIMAYGDSLQAEGDFEGALRQYYHARYIDADNDSANRAIAFAESLAGNVEKSLENWGRLIGKGSATAQDYIRAGHANFIGGNMREALNYYRLGQSKSPADFTVLFTADIDAVAPRGAGKVAMLLLFDQTT